MAGASLTPDSMTTKQVLKPSLWLLVFAQGQKTYPKYVPPLVNFTPPGIHVQKNVHVTDGNAIGRGSVYLTVQYIIYDFRNSMGA